MAAREVTNDSIRQAFAVAFSYPVHFTRRVFDRTNTLLRELLAASATEQRARILFVVDAGVAAAHPDLLAAIDAYAAHHHDVVELAGPPLLLPGGESAKNDPAYVDQVHRAINDSHLCRHSYVAAVGGGAVLDVVGYAAATAHRGIRLLRFPTTVLAQDDSAVGVKNGVNAFGKKNFFGTFAAPAAVINDFAFLPTLDDRDWCGGVSEAVKVALIKDPAFFAQIERDAAAVVARDLGVMEAIVRRSAALHLAHIGTSGDPFELGSSRPLDFGHWSAHKLEQLTRHRVSHGEAVAIGIALDSTYSYLAGHLSDADWRRIVAVLRALRLSVYAPELTERIADPDDSACVFRGLDEFREHLGGRLTIMLLRAPGVPFDAHQINHDLMIRAATMLRDIELNASVDEVPHERSISTQPQGTGR